MSDISSRLASLSDNPINSSYLEFSTFFAYNTNLIEIHPALVARIFTRYNAHT